MAKNLGFRDFLTVDYAPGMPDVIKKNAKKRKGDETETSGPLESATPPGGKPIKALTPDQAHKWLDGGKHAKNIGMGWGTKNVTVAQTGDNKGKHAVKVHQYTEEVEIDEALNASQRRMRAMQMKRSKAKIELGRERATRRIADLPRLKKRARREARAFIFKRLTKGLSKEELTYQRRQEIEQRLDTPQMKKRIELLATKLLNKVRKAEVQRHSAGAEKG